MKNEKKALKFLKEIKGKTGIFFHSDCDGACSGAQMIIYLKSKNIIPEVFSGTYEEYDMEDFLEKKFDNYIFLDICFAQFPEFTRLIKNKNVLIIDHHPSKDLSKHGAAHINPRFDDPDVYISASEVCFEILNKITDFSKNKWISRLGGVGDRSLEGDEKEIEGRDIVDSVKIVKKDKGLVSLAKFLSKSEKIEDLLYENRFWKARELVKKEMEKQIAEYELVAYEKITFFQVKGRYVSIGVLSSKLLDMYPKRTIILYKKFKDDWKISARSHTYNLKEIFEKAAKGLGHASGHPVAAGGFITDMDEFKRRCLKMMK